MAHANLQPARADKPCCYSNPPTETCLWRKKTGKSLGNATPTKTQPNTTVRQSNLRLANANRAR